MSPHCPGVVSTVSQDKMLKVFCNLSSSWISGPHHPKILISCLQHFLRSGTSRGPSQPLLVSAPLVLAPFTPFPIVLMCPSSLQLEETKPATISRYDCFFLNYRVCALIILSLLLKVMDLREMAPVRSVFGKRQLKNPLNTSEFGFATAEEAEPAEVVTICA